MSNPATRPEILDDLLSEWGYVMGGAGLRKALGFGSQAALRIAIAQDRMPIRVFTIEGRRGPFALTHDVASWLASRAA